MQRQSKERNVMFGHIEEGKEADTTVQQVLHDKPMEASRIADAVPKFTPCEEFTTFSAEYALQDGNIVIHFFLPRDFKGAQDYWTMKFPRALDPTAQSYFKATAPRLQAKYTEELKSWWFRASGYDHIIDWQKFVESFFEELDRALESVA